MIITILTIIILIIYIQYNYTIYTTIPPIVLSPWSSFMKLSCVGSDLMVTPAPPTGARRGDPLREDPLLHEGRAQGRPACHPHLPRHRPEP